MIILAIVDLIYIEQFLIQEQDLRHILSFRKRLRTFFLFSLYVRRLVVVRLFSSTVQETDYSSISDEH